MQVITLFLVLFLIEITNIYSIKAQLNINDKQPMYLEKYLNKNSASDREIEKEIKELHLSESQVAQEKRNLLFMINFAMRAISSNRVEKDVKQNKYNFTDVTFSVPKDIYIHIPFFLLQIMSVLVVKKTHYN